MAAREPSRQAARREALLARLDKQAATAPHEIMRDHWIRLADAVRRVVAAQKVLPRPTSVGGEGSG